MRRRPATMNLAGLPTGLLQARIEHGYGKKQLAKIVPMEVLTPASPSDLPPLGELVADEPSWRYPPATTAGRVPPCLRRRKPHPPRWEQLFGFGGCRMNWLLSRGPLAAA